MAPYFRSHSSSPRYQRVFLVLPAAFLNNLADLSTPGAKRRRYGERPNPSSASGETSETLANPIRHSKLGFLAASACGALIFPGCPAKPGFIEPSLGFSKSHSIKILLTTSA